jgi:hypothetical protein
MVANISAKGLVTIVVSLVSMVIFIELAETLSKA